MMVDDMCRLQEKERQMLMEQTKPMISITSLLPTHSNIRVGREMEKKWDKGYALNRVKMRREEADKDEEEDEEDEEDGQEQAEGEEGMSPSSEKNDKRKGDSKDQKAAWRTSSRETKARSKRVKLLGNWDSPSSKYSKRREQVDEPISSWDKRDDDDDSPPELEDLGYFGAFMARARTLYFNSKARVLNTANTVTTGIRKATNTIQQKVEEMMGPPKVVVRGGDMWASKAAWYALMVMSRHARLQLVMRSTVLNAVKVRPNIGFVVLASDEGLIGRANTCCCERIHP
jgi:hypothetical protein